MDLGSSENTTQDECQNLQLGITNSISSKLKAEKILKEAIGKIHYLQKKKDKGFRTQK
jgi:hypothetical protein